MEQRILPGSVGLVLVCGVKSFAKLSRAQFWNFLGGSAQGGTLAPNQGETNCWGFVLWVRPNCTAPADTLSKIGNIMNIIFASSLTINPLSAWFFKNNWNANTSLRSCYECWLIISDCCRCLTMNTKPMWNGLTLQINWNADLNMSISKPNCPHWTKLNIMVGKTGELLTGTRK